MIKLKLQLELNYDVGLQGCDFIFNFHAAHTRNQTVTDERLHLSQQVESHLHADPATGNVLRTRPLCSYPKVAKYDGTGSTDVTTNFFCANP